MYTFRTYYRACYMQQSNIRYNRFKRLESHSQRRTIQFGTLKIKTETAMTHLMKSRTNYEKCKRCTSTGAQRSPSLFFLLTNNVLKKILAYTIENWWVRRTKLRMSVWSYCTRWPNWIISINWHIQDVDVRSRCNSQANVTFHGKLRFTLQCTRISIFPRQLHYLLNVTSDTVT